MAWHIKNNVLRIVRIVKVKVEARDVKTLYFRDDLCSQAKPGQFIMAWIPDVDEIPLSISSASNGLASVTVKDVGEATHAISQMENGDILGIRGPFGSHFRIMGRNALIVAGGIGAAPLLMLADRLLSRNVKVSFIEGAKTRSEIIFRDQLGFLRDKYGLEVIFVTDDGTYGLRGTAVDAAEEALSKKRFDSLYACGRESMIRKLYCLAEKYSIPMQASLERIMRCAIGICGSCVMGRYRVCRDGPVFDSCMLRDVMGELGRFKRNFRGEKVPVED
ncbi:dihydroorotate dehydrogenase electron transfer subunit [Candidatus Bathyarchaeota archaeon]|nr:MAG: dihydroorotate dehydrogenase electron transfer subunit [Candidatus Bathyarchaeota archaeon]